MKVDFYEHYIVQGSIIKRFLEIKDRLLNNPKSLQPGEQVDMGKAMDAVFNKDEIYQYVDDGKEIQTVHPNSKGEIVKRLAKAGKLEERKVDYAMPQPWIDNMTSRGFDVQPNFVWYYGEETAHGAPYAITPEGEVILRLATRTLGFLG